MLVPSIYLGDGVLGILTMEISTTLGFHLLTLTITLRGDKFY